MKEKKKDQNVETGKPVQQNSELSSKINPEESSSKGNSAATPEIIPEETPVYPVQALRDRIFDVAERMQLEQGDANEAIEVLINNVPPEVADIKVMLEGLKKGREELDYTIEGLKNLTKPAGKRSAERFMGLKKVKITSDDLKFSRMLVADKETQRKYLDIAIGKVQRKYDMLTESKRKDAKLEKYRLNASDPVYMGKNKKHIADGIGKMLNELNTVKAGKEELVQLKTEKKGKKFSDSFLKIMKERDPRLYYLCTGIKSYKAAFLGSAKASLGSWSPEKRNFDFRDYVKIFK